VKDACCITVITKFIFKFYVGTFIIDLLVFKDTCSFLVFQINCAVLMKLS